jgi:ankyrin repeat protein
MTALMNACGTGCARIAGLLLDRGADPSFIDVDGRTALSLAAASEHEEVVSLLRVHRDELGEAASLR